MIVISLAVFIVLVVFGFLYAIGHNPYKHGHPRFIYPLLIPIGIVVFLFEGLGKVYDFLTKRV